LALKAQTDVILFLLEENLVELVLGAIYENGRFKEPDTGIAFVVDVEGAIEIESQIERFKDESENADKPPGVFLAPNALIT
jgi:nitrogen regulatory protein P-II 1